MSGAPCWPIVNTCYQAFKYTPSGGDRPSCAARRRRCAFATARGIPAHSSTFRAVHAGDGPDRAMRMGLGLSVVRAWSVSRGEVRHPRWTGPRLRVRRATAPLASARSAPETRRPFRARRTEGRHVLIVEYAPTIANPRVCRVLASGLYRRLLEQCAAGSGEKPQRPGRIGLPRLLLCLAAVRAAMFRGLLFARPIRSTEDRRGLIAGSIPSTKPVAFRYAADLCERPLAGAAGARTPRTTASPPFFGNVRRGQHDRRRLIPAACWRARKSS